MKNTKHTPGPWRIILNDTQSGDRTTNHMIYSSTKQVLCVNSCNVLAEDLILMAAAPEMLEACVDYIRDLADKTRSMNTSLSHLDFIEGHSAQSSILAIVRKARGE